MRKSECGMRNFKDKKFLINHAKLSLVLTIRYLCFELRAVNSIFFYSNRPINRFNFLTAFGNTSPIGSKNLKCACESKGVSP